MGIDINIRITGSAGQGVHTAGAFISRIAVAAGYHFHSTQDYMSRIRGGRNSFSIRMMDVPVRAGRAVADILLALDPGHLSHFLPGLRPDGLAFSDTPTVGETGRVTAAPLKELAASAGSPILGNMAGAGIVAHALGVSPRMMDQLLALEFHGEILEKNRKAVRLGSEWASGRLTEGTGRHAATTPAPPSSSSANPSRPAVPGRRSLGPTTNWGPWSCP